jgi:DNA repair protein RadC
MSEITPQYIISPETQRLVDRALKAIKKAFMVAENAVKITNSALFVDYLKLQFCNHDREHFWVLFLNNQNRIIASEKLFSGTLNQVEVHPTVIARKALLHNARALLLAHNHPSGELSPSQADKLVTERVVACLSILDIQVLDHIIIAPNDGYYSFKEHNLL